VPSSSSTFSLEAYREAKNRLRQVKKDLRTRKAELEVGELSVVTVVVVVAVVVVVVVVAAALPPPKPIAIVDY